MDEKGFILGTANRAMVTANAGRRPPRTTHDGARELVMHTIRSMRSKMGDASANGCFQG